MRPALGALIAASVLAGCGASHGAVRSAAIVGGVPIRQAEVQRYLDYTARFYAWAHAARALDTPRACPERQAQERCARLRRQVLARLIEERVVLAYAQQHHIALSVADRVRIARAMQRLAGGQGSTASLLGSGGVDPTFMRSVLRRELLIRKVEEAVAPEATRVGRTYHVKKFAIPLPARESPDQVYREAVDLATDGKPIPPNTQMRVEWLAPFRLATEERQALNVAEPGQYVGPFAHQHVYLIMLLLGRGKHAYGQPARLALQTRYFRSWLQHEIRRSRPHCFDPAGVQMHCPLG